MIIGFTGTQRGMTKSQLDELETNLRKWKSPRGVTDNEFHHGDCVGADAQAHEIAKRVGYETHVHPCSASLAGKRANCEGDFYYDVKAPLERNHDIVDVAEMMVAAPAGPEVVRSGTWATIRYARKEHALLVIMQP